LRATASNIIERPTSERHAADIPAIATAPGAITMSNNSMGVDRLLHPATAYGRHSPGTPLRFALPQILDRTGNQYLAR